MSRSVFAVDRGIWDHPIFAPEPFTEREAWTWMIGAAAWADKRVRVGKRVVDLRRGQLAFATRFLAARWKWSHSRVVRFLKRIETDTMVTTLATRDATLITICNYDKYAFGRNATETQSETPTDTLSERKRNKEEEVKEPKKKEKPIGAVADATRPDAGKFFDEEFWGVYPKREGANPKAPARKAFLIAVKSGHHPIEICNGARRYAASLAKSSQIGTKYVAQAVTWLHQKRWEDYPDDTATTTGPPAPPDPSMPSDQELRRKYGASHGQRDANEGGGIREPGAGVCRETEIDTEDQNRPPDHRTGKSGMAGVGEILPQLFELRSMDHGSGEGGTTNENDGPDTVAGVVRH